MVDVDVVIVNWNSGGQLAECLESIGGLQTGSAFRVSKCIVVDNASSDGSADGLDRMPFGVTVLKNAKNTGFGAGCNQGTGVGAAAYILVLNPDTCLTPDSLLKPACFMEEAENQGVGLLGVRLVDRAGHVQASTARFPTPGALVSQMLGLDRLWPARFPPFALGEKEHQQSRTVDVLQGAFLLVRRSVFEALGGFDEHFFMYYEDVDLAYRASRAGWRSYFLAEAQAFHAGGGSTHSIKASRLAYWMRSRTQYTAKHFGTAAALGVLAAAFGLELWVRILVNLVQGRWQHLGETLQAYVELGRALPGLLQAPFTKKTT
jgi:GT2 family glycosyltransferase